MRFRFSIRDLLWLVLTVALCMAWWLDRSRLALEASSLRQRTEDLERSISILELALMQQKASPAPAGNPNPQSP
jgi:hypothetical protein